MAFGIQGAKYFATLVLFAVEFAYCRHFSDNRELSNIISTHTTLNTQQITFFKSTKVNNIKKLQNQSLVQILFIIFQGIKINKKPIKLYTLLFKTSCKTKQ